MSSGDAPSPRIGSAVLIVDGDRILLGRRAKDPNRGRWVIPGGKIEFGENYRAAGAREAREEVGLTIDVEGLAGRGVYELIAPGEHRIIIYSRARPTAGVLKPSSDIDEARFFTRDELASLDITPVVREVLCDEGWLS